MKSFTLQKNWISVITTAYVSPPLGGIKDIANTDRGFVNVVLTFMGRTAKGQSRELNEDQTAGKQLRVMSVDQDPSNACSDDIQINSDSQRREALMRR